MHRCCKVLCERLPCSTSFSGRTIPGNPYFSTDCFANGHLISSMSALAMTFKGAEAPACHCERSEAIYVLLILKQISFVRYSGIHLTRALPPNRNELIDRRPVSRLAGIGVWFFLIIRNTRTSEENAGSISQITISSTTVLPGRYSSLTFSSARIALSIAFGCVFSTSASSLLNISRFVSSVEGHRQDAAGKPC